MSCRRAIGPRPGLCAAPMFAGWPLPGLRGVENASYENAALLARAGIPIAIRSGYESYVPKNRVLLFEAAIAAVNGLGEDAALRAITLAPAEMLGIAADYGSTGIEDRLGFDADGAAMVSRTASASTQMVPQWHYNR